MLRLPDKMPKQMKIDRVDELIKVLDLQKCINTRIGGIEIQGLSGGEKKRANIACELLTNPKLMLLDEPTSGLDSSTSYSLIKTLKDYSVRQGKTIITTIHQPSSQIFYTFDKLLLLCDGRVAYYGNVKEVTQFFSNINIHCSPEYNPADFIIEKVKDEYLKGEIFEAAEKKLQTIEWPSEQRQEISMKNNENTVSKSQSTVTYEKYRKYDDIDALPSEGCNGTSVQLELGHDFYTQSKWQTKFTTQLVVLTKRNFKASLGRILSKMAVSVNVFTAIVMSLLWFRLKREEDSLNNRIGMIFFISIHLQFSTMIDAIQSFPFERPIINKERSSGAYRLSAYISSKYFSETPLQMVLPFVIITLTYWCVNLHAHAGYFCIYLLLGLLNALAASGVGMCIGSILNDFQTSVTSAAIYGIVNMMAGGWFIRNIPPALAWLKHISLVGVSFNSLLKVELNYGPDLKCSGLNETTFDICKRNGTLLSGKEVIRSLGFTRPLWLDILVLSLIAILTRLVVYASARYYQTANGPTNPFRNCFNKSSSCPKDTTKNHLNNINFPVNDNLRLLSSSETENYNIPKRFSRLHQTLNELLQDNDSIKYLLRYLETKGFDHYLKFWLEVVSFKSTTTSRTNASNQGKNSNLANGFAEKGISEDLRNDVMSRMCMEDGSVDPNCFNHCQNFVLEFIYRAFEGYNNSKFFYQRQIDILTSNVRMPDILFYQAAFFYFMEFMEREGGSILIECWIAMDNFEYGESAAQEDAMVIYDKYFSLQAISPVGFDDKIRFEIETNICREGGPLKDCFLCAQKVVLCSLERIYLPVFLKSDLYLKYLDELISAAKNQHKRNSSNGSNNSIHQATASSHPKKSTDKVSENFTIDNSLFEPDTLWQRDEGQMTLGRINEWGEYVRRFEPEPENDKRNFVEKIFVRSKEKDKTEEDMASQVAKMIINDIVSVTKSTKK
ncbi:DgyrCDS14351 [Dimorphilus gyrociliatus]|uniref:DgyrCDS14351 n=1 Tax=Dimorphilus gyrociliatus TaxID=2664684 RepID=A0A7I8WDB2_9ANNE|nr:DgyrCDS14351 [Dimorphilus gyrociliatus]